MLSDLFQYQIELHTQPFFDFYKTFHFLWSCESEIGEVYGMRSFQKEVTIPVDRGLVADRVSGSRSCECDIDHAFDVALISESQILK